MGLVVRPDGTAVSSVGRVINVLAALLVSAAVLALFAVGYGPVPALGRALVPGHGAWASAPGGQPIHSQTLSLPGLAHPVSVAFTSHGVASVRAADEADAYLALGYLHARFRLTEMDLERRLGEGRIAQLAGPAGLSSDRFELRLGLLRTAQAEWAATPRTSPAARCSSPTPAASTTTSPRPAAPASGPPSSASPASTRPPGPPSTASSSRASSPRSSTTPPPRSTTRSSNAPSAPPTPWPGSRSSPPAPRHPLRPRPLPLPRPRPHRPPSAGQHAGNSRRKPPTSQAQASGQGGSGGPAGDRQRQRGRCRGRQRA